MHAPTPVRFHFDLDWPYDDALAAMLHARDEVIAGGPMTVFVGSHREEVITLGRHAPESQLMHRPALEARNVLVRRIERGGGATAHGPGQLVVYPVVHLPTVGLDILGMTRALLEACCDLAWELGHGGAEVRLDPAGVWVPGPAGPGKLASIGMRVEHGVVTHGVALNVDNDLGLFDLIAPCGVQCQPMASIRGPFRRGANVSTSVTEDRTDPNRGSGLDQDIARRLAFHVARRCVLAWKGQDGEPDRSDWSAASFWGIGPRARATERTE